ncbi:MAG: hypothetical protein PHC64_08785 [Candidatus Gastranaerophilales bacterium]|nr:hypothetical protein [Candidatus Gastranaerophilales bacterium]
MTYPISQQSTQYRYPPSSSGGNNPEFQNVDGEKVKHELVQNHALKNVIGEEKEAPLLVAALTLPVWGGMAIGMDKFNNSCGGAYSESVLGKISRFGDRVASRVRFIDPMVAKIEKGIKWFHDTVVPKSEFLDAFFNRATSPENKMVLMISRGTGGEIAVDICQKLEYYLNQGGQLLDETGKVISKENAQQIIKDLTEKAYIKEQAEQGAREILKFCQAQGEREFDFRRVGHLRKIPLIGPKLPDFYFSDIDPTGNIGKLFGTKGKWSECANKLKAFIDPQGTRLLGRRLPGFTIRFIEGITNGTAAGKIAILMAAGFIADAIKDAIFAPKGEKTATFMENNVNGLGFYLLMPLGICLMHKFGGLRYLGVSTKKVKEYREQLKILNEKTLKTGAEGFATKADYIAERKRIQELLKMEIPSKHMIVRGFKKALYSIPRLGARILTVGLDTARGFNANSIGKNLVNKFGYFSKFAAGYPVRMLVYMGLIGPFLANFFTRGSHVIFGKPTKSIIDGEKEAEGSVPTPSTVPTVPPAYQEQAAQYQAKIAQEQAVQAAQFAAQMQAAKQAAQAQAAAQVQQHAQMPVKPQQPQVKQPNTISKTPPMQPLNQGEHKLAYTQENQVKRENLVDMNKSGEIKKIMEEPKEPVRNYVPSAEGVKIDNSKPTKEDEKVNELLTKSDHAEQKAHKLLK